jgi:hypothetical protein
MGFVKQPAKKIPCFCLLDENNISRKRKKHGPGKKLDTIEDLPPQIWNNLTKYQLTALINIQHYINHIS